MSGEGRPSVADVEAISAGPDAVVRNFQITQAYHELSLALAARTGPVANWCTFATWASRQAGQTIRGEDLSRRIARELGDTDEVRLALERTRALLRAVGRVVDQARVVAAIREVFSPAAALARSSEAVGRGNRKVFEEIARQFARFLDVLNAGGLDDPGLVERFCGDLRPGDPPEGQDLLAAAFRGYHRALAPAGAKARAEHVLLANLRVGLHEQTRLQPEIVAALDAAVVDPVEARTGLVERLVPPGRLATVLARVGPLDEACRRLSARLRRLARAVLTDELMTLTLPDGALRLGRDVPGPFPEHLESLADPDLVTLLARIDPTPDSPRASGAKDWASLPERMHFIADLFRARQDAPSLHAPPFSPDQTRAIKEGGHPGGRP